MTAADAVAKSPKDGYTALMMSNGRARYRPKDNGDEEADVDGGSAQHICGTCQCYGKRHWFILMVAGNCGRNRLI